MHDRSWTKLVASLLVLLPLSSACAETGVTATTILIGQSVSLSGPTGSLGQEMQAGAVASQVVPFPWNSGIPIVKEYQTVMKAETGKSEYSFLTLESYLSARILVEGLRRAGRDLTREKLIAALETMHDVDFGGFHANFSRNDHAGSRFVELTVIGMDGRILR